ncbi:MAG: TolC family protein [Bacteroidota bacterium]|nr:TolC family protein [Bacteroidota bacterium]
MKSFSIIFFLLLNNNLFAQDSVSVLKNYLNAEHDSITVLKRNVAQDSVIVSRINISIAQDSLTVEDAIRYAIDHNYGIIITKNSIEIGRINNSWAIAGAYPTISATANKTIGSSNIQQKLNNGSDINRNGAITQNLNAGININYRVFDGYKAFATKKRLEELERNGEYTFRKNLNEIVYNVVVTYYNIVKLNQQLKATLDQISLYQERYMLAEMKFNIGSGAKFEVLQAGVDLNEQRSNQLSIQNQINIAKTNLYNLIGKRPDTAYKVADTILVKPIPDMASVETKASSQNPDVLLANSDLAILIQSKKEINAYRFPIVTLNGNYNFIRNSNGAGLTLYNQSYGPSASIGVAVPIFNGGITKKQLRVADIQIKNQNLTIEQLKANLNTSVVNAFINYQNAIAIVALEKANLSLAVENISIASQRFKLLNITSVELRQVQISYADAENRLYNALYQAKLAEAEVALLTGDISNL